MIVLVSTVAFLGTGRVMEVLEERVGLTLLERPFNSFFTSSSSVPAKQSHKQRSPTAILPYLFSKKYEFSLKVFSLQSCHRSSEIETNGTFFRLDDNR